MGEARLFHRRKPSQHGPIGGLPVTLPGVSGACAFSTRRLNPETGDSSGGPGNSALLACRSLPDGRENPSGGEPAGSGRLEEVEAPQDNFVEDGCIREDPGQRWTSTKAVDV